MKIDRHKAAKNQDDNTNPAAGEPVCPHCGGVVQRVHRRVTDRLMSIFVKVHRYSCKSFGCGWEGCLRVKRKGSR